MTTGTSDLQLRLARDIAVAISDGSLESGAHLREVELCEQYGVSRSPIRAALGILLDRNLVQKQANRGFFVSSGKTECLDFLDGLPKSGDDRLKEQIAKDWYDAKISQEVSEGEIRQRYDLGRLTTQRILNALSEDGIVSRMPGYGWRFEATLNTQEAHDESYAFRLAVEPSGILLPDFEYDAKAGSFLRESHESLLDVPEKDWQLSALFQLDEDFHDFVAKCSNNRFIVQSVKLQNRLRRLLEYNSLLNTGRFRESCGEHLGILRALEDGDRRAASKAMEEHLKSAKDAGPGFEADTGGR